MAYEILDYKGDVLIPDVTEEELQTLIGEAMMQGLNYFQYDSYVQNDLVTVWQNADSNEMDVTRNRIYRLKD